MNKSKQLKKEAEKKEEKGGFIEYLEHCDEIIKSIKAYLDNLEQLGFSGKYPNLSSEILEMLDFLKSSLEEMRGLWEKISPKLDIEKLIVHGFRLIYIMKKGIKFLEDILNIFHQNKPNFAQIGSNTSGSSTTKEHIIDMINALGSIQELCEKIIIMYDDLNFPKIVSSIIVNNLHDEKNVDQTVIEYKKYFSDNSNGQFVVDFYCLLLNKILAISASHTITSTVLNQIESLKTNILITKEWNDTNRDANTIQFLIQKNRLVPDCELMPIDKLIFKYFEINVNIGKKINVEKILNDLMDSLGVGFILIYKICGNIEYKFGNLIFNPLLDNQFSGINQQLGKLTETIRPISHLNDDTKLTSRVLKMGNFEKYYIIETLDGYNFRFLRTWKSNMAVAVGPIWDKKATPSPRIANYNLIQNNIIAEHIGEPIFKEIEKPTINYWQIIRERIIVKNEEFLREQINKIIGKEEITKKEQEILNFLTSDEVINRLINSIIEIILQGLSKNLRSLEKMDAATQQIIQKEIKITYMGDLENIQKKMRGNVEQKFSELKSKSLSLNFGKIFETLQSSLEFFTNRNENIFLNIENKLQILSAVFGK